MPTSMIDYNIISLLPTDQHHWAKPEERPRAVQRSPKVRTVQAAQLRDFNVVNNEYHQDHKAKTDRDVKLTRLEVTHKYNQQNFFDPVMQKYNERDVEERARCCDDAREAEVCMRGEMNKPSFYASRVSAHYDLVTHQADAEGALNLERLDASAELRKSGYKARYISEHQRRMADIMFEDLEANQRHDFVAHERWEETKTRGYNIVTNRAFGNGPKFEKAYEPFTIPRVTTWEKVLQDRSGLTPPASPRIDSKGNSGSVAVPALGSTSATAVSVLESAAAAAAGPGPGAPCAADLPKVPSAVATPRGSVSGTGSAGVVRSARATTPRGSAAGTPRSRATPRTLSEAGSATLGSTRGRPPLLGMSGKAPEATMLPTSLAPPPPPIPGSPVGSVYSRPKV